MQCVYETFDFLMTSPVFEKVLALRTEHCEKFNIALAEVERAGKKKNTIRKKEYTDIALNHAAILHLCEFFLLNKESHDMHAAILEINTLTADEQKLIAKDEFEAAAAIRDKKEAIRNYLAKINANGKQATESSPVSIL